MRNSDKLGSEFNVDEYGTSLDMGYGDMPEGNSITKGKNQSDDRPRILLMGLRRSGKSSIQKVVFHKMAPNETLFLESTHKIQKDDLSNSSIVQFQIWDFPGQIDFFDPSFDGESIFGQCGSLIFVIDSQDDFSDALQKLQDTIKKASSINSKINFEVFIHKVDGLSDEHRIETQRDIQQKITEWLTDEDQEPQVTYHLTSIYDHSIFEAFSKVVQKLIPYMDTLENLLDILISNCGMEKAFLIDVMSKIYVASDSGPVTMESYELCTDMIDVVIDVSCIYSTDKNQEGDIQLHSYDQDSQSIIKLKKPTENVVLYLREVNKYLALVTYMREDNFNKHGVINYNFKQFKNAIQQVFSKMRMFK